MEIVISEIRTLGDIHKDFSKAFPYLKLEFFDMPYDTTHPAPKSKMFPHDRKLSTIRKKHTEGSIEIMKNMTVAEFEIALWNEYGLSVQVFRKSGNLWIETSLTDSWTLERQNKEGYEMSRPHKNPYEEANENDFTDRDKWD